MKHIFSKLNAMQTPAESGERMNRFEQERYYEQFSVSTKDNASAQKGIRMSAHRVLAAVACAAVVIGGGCGIYGLYRNTPTAPPVANGELAEPVTTEATEPVAAETTTTTAETEIALETTAAVTTAIAIDDSAAPIHLVSAYRDGNHLVKMNFTADVPQEPGKANLFAMVDGVPLTCIGGSSDKDFEIMVRVPANATTIDVGYNNELYTFALPEVTHPAIFTTKDGNLTVSSLGITYKGDSAMDAFVNEEYEKRGQGGTYGLVSLMGENDAELVEIQIFGNALSAPLLTQDGSYCEDGAIWYHWNDGEVVVPSELFDGGDSALKRIAFGDESMELFRLLSDPVAN